MMRVKTPHFLRTSLETFPIQCYGMQCYGDLQRGCSAREWFLGFDCLQAGLRACGRDQRTEPVWRLSGRPRHPFGSPLISLYDPQRRQGAAALSAAVTTTKPQGIAPTSHGRTSREEKSSLFPATLRERGSGGEVLLLEKQPLPRSLPTYPPESHSPACFTPRISSSLAVRPTPRSIARLPRRASMALMPMPPIISLISCVHAVTRLTSR